MTAIPIEVQSPYVKRTFSDSNGGLRTISLLASASKSELLENGTANEGIITINDKAYEIGGKKSESFAYQSHTITPLEAGGHRLQITFAAPTSLPNGLTVTAIYEAPGNSSALVKWLRVDNSSNTAVRLDALQVEEIKPKIDGEMSLMLENDYVRGAMMINGESVRSPWIEEQPVYVDRMLNTKSETTVFAYPVEMDRWLVPGARFESFNVYEFAITTKSEERRGLGYRKALSALFPWTCRDYTMACIPTSTNVEDYYKGFESAAEAGYESAVIMHGWIEGKLTDPLFTNYNDYILRPELFPNGYADVKKLTDFARSKGLKRLGFYTIYVNTWREDEKEVWAHRENQWELIWAEDDKSVRWGKTLDPGTDWGPFVNRKIEEAILKGGFNFYSLDGPYYGDVSVAENRGYIPGGPNQVIAWERQVEFYERMRALGIDGEAAQGFQAYAHGMNRIGTSGYDEGDFFNKGMWDQIFATRYGAYTFTKIYRPEQSHTFIPVVSWGGGHCLEPMEDNAGMYDAAMGVCFGYGFRGRTYQRVAWEGPKSKAVVQRWMGFFNARREFFSNGNLLHVRKPDNKNIDAVAHVLQKDGKARAVLVAYNPTDAELTDELTIPFGEMDLALSGWKGKSEKGEPAEVKDGKIKVTVPARNATWFDLELGQ